MTEDENIIYKTNKNNFDSFELKYKIKEIRYFLYSYCSEESI